MRQHLPSLSGLPLRALAAATLIALTLPSTAQTSNATLRGTVSSAGKTAPNAEVAATNVATGYTLRIRTNANGDYALVGLPPGTYKIVATADGQVSQNEITLQVGQAASLDLAVAAPATTTLNTVTVVGSANVQDKTTSEIGTYVTPQQLQRLPQVSRNFLSQADLAPGVNVEYDAQGNVKLRSGASGREAVNVFIDGVGQKDYVLRGGVTGQDNSRGNPFPQSAIGEYKVITQNYKAEYDQVSSAVITAATKSGTNDFHGDVFYDHTGANLRAATPQEKLSGNKADTSQEQYGASIGGAFVKDVLHYFIAYEAKDNRDPLSVVAGGDPSVIALLPPAVAAQQGPLQSPFHEDLFFSKLDYSLDDRNHFDLSFKFRNERDRKNLGGTATESFSSNNQVRERRFDLHHQFNADQFTNDARITYENVFFGQVPLDSVDVGATYAYFPANSTNPTTVLQTGGNNYFQQKSQKGLALQDDFTYTGLASHVIKFGAKIKWITVDAIEQANGNPQYFYDLQSSNSTTPFRVDVGYPLAGVGDGATSSQNKQFGLYLQDDWEVNKRLTLNLGARYDIEWSPTYLDHVTPSDVLAALNSQDPRAPTGQTYAQSLANGGVNLNDYISTGSNRKPFAGGFAPRLGFSYDLTGDKQNVAFGGYGRSYDRNIFDVLQLENTKGTFPNATIQFNGVNGGCAPGQSTCLAYQPSYGTRAGLQPLITQNAGREVDLIRNDLKTPYSDQFSIGIRNSIGIWQTEATISRIQQRDGFVWLLGNR
ncbi:MAG: TonB-dependent receptor, partial [Pseudomonadota bacterium]|nr:TonB-dependent receptor [Pseudomonadota bacterium]